MRIEDHFNLFPVLETGRTRLRKVTYEDQNHMYEYCKNPEVSAYTVWDAHQSPDDTRQFLDFVQHRYETEHIGPWAIEDKHSRKMIGTCGFVNWDNRNQKAELGYALSYDYWNKGYMTEVVRRIIEFGFQDMGLVRVEARCHPSNMGSARVMEKSGMLYEGLLRRHIFAKGEFQDVKMYSIIREDIIKPNK